MLKQQLRHHWGVSALFRWLPLKAQAGRNVCFMGQQLMQVENSSGRLLFFVCSSLLEKENVAGCWTMLLLPQRLGHGWAVAEFTSLPEETGNDARNQLALCGSDLALSTSMTPTKSFVSDFCLTTRLGSPFLGHGHSACDLFLADF